MNPLLRINNAQFITNEPQTVTHSDSAKNVNRKVLAVQLIKSGKRFNFEFHFSFNRFMKSTLEVASSEIWRDFIENPGILISGWDGVQQTFNESAH